MRKYGIFLFVFLALIAGCSSSSENKEKQKENHTMTGFWQGKIEIPNQSLAIELDIKGVKDLTGTISIPVQGLVNYPLSTIELTEGQHIVFTMNMQNQLISFAGEIKGDAISGTFTQNGQSFPFQLTKNDKKVVKQEEGNFLEVKTDTGTLFAELESPEGDGPFPIMIIIPGSGPTDRNGNSIGFSGKNDSLKRLAENLAKKGIASIRYDKRGVGKNQQAVINESKLRFEEFVHDASLWIDKLQSDKRFSKIGIIGHSQGSLIGMIVAAEQNIDVFVSIAGAGRTIDKVMYDQLSEQLTDAALEEVQRILSKLRKGETVNQVRDELQAILRPSIQPFLSSWIQYEPTQIIKTLTIPILIVHGEHDIQVSVREADALAEANLDATKFIVGRMNHVLKEAPADRDQNIQTYTNPDLPLAPGLTEGIIDFLRQVEFINDSTNGK
ncbi:alpha/beta hydrolase [Virgibacillus sp. Bac332]|uniref:alpha/beta hydrolase n=1 Tax=Virgibacillus sp. Bac332 TaxID=2419842 RepID=UPI001F08DD6B|nr:alpha/beta fold hydrolase [Virgibacillus sp. Bac332]